MIKCIKINFGPNFGLFVGKYVLAKRISRNMKHGFVKPGFDHSNFNENMNYYVVMSTSTSAWQFTIEKIYENKNKKWK